MAAPWYSERDLLQDLVQAGEERRQERSEVAPVAVLELHMAPDRLVGLVQGVGDIYACRISTTHRQHHCTCPDSQRRGRQIGPCKHTLALAKHRLAELEAPAIAKHPVCAEKGCYVFGRRSPIARSCEGRCRLSCSPVFQK